MAIEAPYSKYRKTNFKIAVVILVVLAGWFFYDGYYNERFINTHKDAEGNPDSTLAFNQKSPPWLILAVVVAGAYLFIISSKKIIAEENELIISHKEKIPYDAIQKIDKTHFESKGFFIITYNDKDGPEVRRRLSDRAYDNLSAVLEHLVAKIS